MFRLLYRLIKKSFGITSGRNNQVNSRRGLIITGFLVVEAIRAVAEIVNRSDNAWQIVLHVAWFILICLLCLFSLYGKIFATFIVSFIMAITGLWMAAIGTYLFAIDHSQYLLQSISFVVGVLLCLGSALILVDVRGSKRKGLM